MDSTSSNRRDELARYVPAIVVAVVAAVAVPLGVTRGAPTVVLWLAFSVLAGAVLLFWESVRLLLDPTAPGDGTAEGTESGVPAELETRKRAALRALRDIEYERAIQRLSEEDYRTLEQKYRAEARAAMRAIDEGLAAWLPRADALLAEAEAGAPNGEVAPPTADTAQPAEPATVTGRACPKCNARNDADAVFCKKCGARVAEGTDA